jgi:hypothetical protein
MINHTPLPIRARYIVMLKSAHMNGSAAVAQVRFIMRLINVLLCLNSVFDFRRIISTI